MTTEVTTTEAIRVSLEIGEGPCDPTAAAAHVHDFISHMRAEEPRILGFPGNLAFDFSDLAGILGVLLNNVGDADSPDASDINTKAYEREVLRFLARISGGEPEDTYGYVTGSGTEGNLFGLHLGRRRLPDAPIYCSEAAHYGIQKIADLLRMELVQVPCGSDRGIDADALRAECRRRRGRGAVLVATVGTTMHGAIDDVASCAEAAAVAGATHIHVDAASGGIAATFAPFRLRWGFDAGADSVAISGHKLIGSPVPCGIAMARRELVAAWPAGEYTGATDSTLSCSRSGLAALLLWYGLCRRGRRGLEAEIRRALEVAAHAERRLAELARHPWRHPASLTVVFDRPSAAVCAKWHLPTEGGLAHLIAVPHVTTEAVDDLCRDLEEDTDNATRRRRSHARNARSLA